MSRVSETVMQGQKVNYNLKQLTKKAWKKLTHSTALLVPADDAYPAEDDCTGCSTRLLRLQQVHSFAIFDPPHELHVKQQGGGKTHSCDAW